jgi:Protein of unknown function (DUF1499)
MMRREFVRRPSRAAKMALPPAIFAPVLGAVATLFHRLGWMENQNYIIVLFVSFLLALAGAGLALMGLRSLWTRASLGGLRSAAALLFTLPVLVPAGAAVWLASTTAPLSDVSTDLDDPPHFSSLAGARAAANVNEPPRLKPDLQKQFYPAATGRRYQLSADAIHALVVSLVEEAGWTIRGEATFIPGSGEWQIEALVTTPVTGFRDEVIVRLTDEGESTFVDMRSASMFGANDLGTNARRIVDFMKALDLRVQSTGVPANAS